VLWVVQQKKTVGTHWTGTHELKSFDVRVGSIDSGGNATVRVFWEVEMADGKI
jgi:hypothetical protein